MASTASIPDVTFPMIWYVLAEDRISPSLSSRTMKNWDPTESGADVRAIATVPRTYGVETGSSVMV